jgi:hypothetical protein
LGISHLVAYGTLGEKHLSPVPHTMSSWISCSLHKRTTLLLPVGALGEDLVTIFCDKLNLLLCDAKESGKKKYRAKACNSILKLLML